MMSHMNKKMNRREAMAGAAAIVAAAEVPAVPGIAVPVTSMGQLVRPQPKLDAICWGRMRAASDAARLLAALRLTLEEIEALRSGRGEISEWAKTIYPGLRIAQQMYSRSAISAGKRRFLKVDADR